MLPRIEFIHGVRSKADSRPSCYAPYFEAAGFRTRANSYGWVPALSSYFINRPVINTLAGVIEPGSILVAHSNGAAIAVGVAEQVPCKGLVLLQPALDWDIAFPASLRWVLVYYNANDWVVRISALMPFHSWGSMGSRGPKWHRESDKYPDFRVQACDTLSIVPPLSGHSAIVAEENRPFFGPRLVNDVLRQLSLQT